MLRADRDSFKGLPKIKGEVHAAQGFSSLHFKGNHIQQCAPSKRISIMERIIRKIHNVGESFFFLTCQPY